MPDTIITDYFYGDESQQFTYFRIPRLLITSPRFKHLSVDAKLLYGMMLDRMSLSVKNEWYDEDGRVYISYAGHDTNKIHIPRFKKTCVSLPIADSSRSRAAYSSGGFGRSSTPAAKLRMNGSIPMPAMVDLLWK